jgi:porphobilinogen deaminase
MEAHADVQAGICGFRTAVVATCANHRHVQLAVTSDCETVGALAAALREHGPFDAFDEIDSRTESALMAVVRAHLKGCCAGCAVPVGLFKAMQVAAGLALPREVVIELTKE